LDDGATAEITAEDRLEIREVLASWNIAEDQRRPEPWADLFADDGVRRFGGGNLIIGREALLADAQERAVNPAMDGWTHWSLGDPVITPTADGAAVRHYATVIDRNEGGWRPFSLSERSYLMCKIDGRWRITERTIRTLPLGLQPHAVPMSDGVGAESAAKGSLSADDRLEIQELITRYSIYEDTGEAEAMANLFTEDGSTVNPRGEATAGRSALAESARRRWESPQVHHWVHWASNVIIESADGGAQAYSYHMILAVDGAESHIRSVVAKRDLLRRESGRWLFVRREVVPLSAG
jgi:uncharacterized protein (TIGR02246 family)